MGYRLLPVIYELINWRTPMIKLLLVLAIVLLVGVVTSLLAVRSTLRAPILAALRQE